MEMKLAIFPIENRMGVENVHHGSVCGAVCLWELDEQSDSVVEIYPPRP